MLHIYYFNSVTAYFNVLLNSFLIDPICAQGSGLAHMPAAVVKHVAMHAPWIAAQPAAALVSQAHQPTGPVTPAVRPEALMHAQ